MLTEMAQRREGGVEMDASKDKVGDWGWFGRTPNYLIFVHDTRGSGESPTVNRNIFGGENGGVVNCQHVNTPTTPPPLHEYYFLCL